MPQLRHHTGKKKKQQKRIAFFEKKIESDEELILKQLTVRLIDHQVPLAAACLLMCYQNIVTLDIYSFTTS